MTTLTKPEQHAMERVSKARSRLVIHHPFFATLALKLRLVAATGIDTAATDGRKLLFDPAFIAGLTDDETTGVVAHEALHCALGHPFRLGNRDRRLANIAMDLVVNPIVLSAGLTLPKGHLYEKRFDDPKMYWEKVYAILLAEQPPSSSASQPDGDDKASGAGHGNYGGCGEVLAATAEDGSAASEADREGQARDWQIATYQAAQAAKAQGNLPGNLRRLIEEMQAPKVDWHARLREFMREIAATDYSWRRANRRLIGVLGYLPSLFDEGMGPLLLGIDSSGSNAWAMPLVCGELNGILDTVRPERVDVVYCDAAVDGDTVEVFRPDDYPVRIRPAGFGGTHLAPIFTYAAENDLNPACAVIITDLELSQHDLGEDPGYPVLVLSTGGRTACFDGPIPFGELVTLEQPVAS